MAELFVTTGDNVAHIVQQGDAWNTEVTLKDSHAQCLALDPLHPGTLFVGTFGKGVWKSSDNGRTWHNMNMPQENVFSIAVSPVDGAVYAGCEPSMLFRSEDGGQTWQRIDSGRDLHYTWSLALDPSDPECWFISACPGPREAHNPKGNAQAYIYRWRGNGPWQVLNGGLPQPLKNFPYALASVQGQLFAGLSNGHIYVSHDRGDSWHSLTLTGDALPGMLALAYVESERVDESAEIDIDNNLTHLIISSFAALTMITGDIVEWQSVKQMIPSIVVTLMNIITVKKGVTLWQIKFKGDLQK